MFVPPVTEGTPQTRSVGSDRQNDSRLWATEWMCSVYPAHTVGQVSKFPSPFWVTWNTTNIDWGWEQNSSLDSACCFQLSCRSNRLRACVHVRGCVCVWNMRHPLLLLLGLLLLQQSRCFVEFVIDSEWEKETVSQNPKTLLLYHSIYRMTEYLEWFLFLNENKCH